MTSRIWDHFTQSDDKTGNLRLSVSIAKRTLLLQRCNFQPTQTYEEKTPMCMRMHAQSTALGDQQLQLINLDGFVKNPKKYPHHKSNSSMYLSFFVAKDLVPFSVVESSYFHELMLSVDPRYQITTRKHLVNKLLQDMYTEALHLSFGLAGTWDLT
ncbi:uncharacterized protein LOC119573152 [Penaeus monodon]|uniref:uncharacterized protein LOC119573152 n=1 Tax=Penaeus monodon TaxID=6687 RepID=UPI0018A76519|nr:uncharacterized protein LOC119573152 [Penaeus monodon]